MSPHFQLLALATVAISLPGGLNAASAGNARVTAVANDVQLIEAGGAPRAASVNDIVSEKTALRTGNDSRVEVTLGDDTVVRAAANTSFDFKNGPRDLNLETGAVLVQASKKASHAKIQASEVVAAITGTTAMFEYHPGVCKFLVLQGTGRLYRPRHWGDSVLVRPGQMIIGNPATPLSDPVDFDIGRFVTTSRFIVDLPPLRSEQLIASETQKQVRDKSKKRLIDTNLVIFGGGTMVSLVDPSQLDLGKVKPADSANRTPAPASGESTEASNPGK
ncbi:MAG: FecR family protein [Verrucomicrobiota bacterium]